MLSVLPLRTFALVIPLLSTSGALAWPPPSPPQVSAPVCSDQWGLLHSRTSHKPPTSFALLLCIYHRLTRNRIMPVRTFNSIMKLLKYIGENIDKYLCALRIWKWFLNTKAKKEFTKKRSVDLIRIKFFNLPSLRKSKGKLELHRHIAYLEKALKYLRRSSQSHKDKKTGKDRYLTKKRKMDNNLFKYSTSLILKLKI